VQLNENPSIGDAFGKKHMMISHLHFLFLMFMRGMTLILDEIPINPTGNLVEAPKPIHDTA